MCAGHTYPLVVVATGEVTAAHAKVQLGPVRPTHEPSGHCRASAEHIVPPDVVFDDVDVVPQLFRIAISVSGPTYPVAAEMPLANWKSRTARTVKGPKTPVGVTER